MKKLHILKILLFCMLVNIFIACGNSSTETTTTASGTEVPVTGTSVTEPNLLGMTQDNDTYTMGLK